MNLLLNGMNDKQVEAVQTTEGPLLIMAGAGSGKTPSFDHRIAYLIDEKWLIHGILSWPFMNKAARDEVSVPIPGIQLHSRLFDRRPSILKGSYSTS